MDLLNEIDLVNDLSHYWSGTVARFVPHSPIEQSYLVLVSRITARAFEDDSYVPEWGDYDLRNSNVIIHGSVVVRGEFKKWKASLMEGSLEPVNKSGYINSVIYVQTHNGDRLPVRCAAYIDHNPTRMWKKSYSPQAYRLNYAAKLPEVPYGAPDVLDEETISNLFSPYTPIKEAYHGILNLDGVSYAINEKYAIAMWHTINKPVLVYKTHGVIGTLDEEDDNIEVSLYKEADILLEDVSQYFKVKERVINE